VLLGTSDFAVIPAKAGIQLACNSLKKLDSSFRWNDEQKQHARAGRERMDFVRARRANVAPAL
jgi:hypothetical protein